MEKWATCLRLFTFHYSRVIHQSELTSRTPGASGRLVLVAVGRMGLNPNSHAAGVVRQATRRFVDLQVQRPGEIRRDRRFQADREWIEKRTQPLVALRRVCRTIPGACLLRFPHEPFRRPSPRAAPGNTRWSHRSAHRATAVDGCRLDIVRPR